MPTEVVLDDELANVEGLVVTAAQPETSVENQQVEVSKQNGGHKEGVVSEHGMSQLEWQDYEDLYNRWRNGGLTDDAVRNIGGTNLLDLMEAQFILDIDDTTQEQGVEEVQQVWEEWRGEP